MDGCVGACTRTVCGCGGAMAPQIFTAVSGDSDMLW